MNIEYHHWWSPHLGQNMELKVYGHSGKPILVFPAMCGRFYEFEDFRMIDATWQFIEGGKVQFFTVDSIDSQSWANWGRIPPIAPGGTRITTGISRGRLSPLCISVSKKPSPC